LKQFVLVEFLTDLEKQLSKINMKISDTNVNSDVCSITTIFKDILDKLAPLHPMSRGEKKLSDKPWITSGILQSIKTKNKLFKKVFKTNDSNQKAFCKKLFEQTNSFKKLSIKTKNKLFKKVFKTNDSDQNAFYKKYSN